MTTERGKGKEKEEEVTTITTHNSYAYMLPQQSTYCRPKLICINCGKKLLSMGVCCGDDEEYQMATRFYCCPCILECFGRPKWRMASVMAEGATTSKLLKIKNNLLTLLEPKYIPTFNVFGNIENNLEKFYKYYQCLALTKEEQEEYLAQLNTQLCNHCLIPYDFQYCNECNLIYNPLPHIIYTIPKEKKPISSCVSESESIFDLNSNSDDNDDENTSSNYIQYGNENNSDSNSNSNYKQYIALSDLTKEQELKWFSNNNKNIMPKHTHNTDAEFNLRYLGKDAIKLEPHSHTYIDLKVALEIPATTIVQLASRSSLVKRGINIRGGIIDAGYIGNIIAML
ncbi:hypothetical protein G9A89_017244 [Geosiphon pyriformis]|nr:hypothetical protein G9A89_017244 [Geosiphon pyriformis]